MIDVNLRYIHECSFVRGEHTNYDLWKVLARRSGWSPLKAGEALALLSKQRNQIIFVYKPMLLALRGKDVRVTVSAKIRLHSKWQLSPDTLKLAAQEAGLNIMKFARFSKAYAALDA